MKAKVRSLFKLPFVVESTSVQPVANPESRFNPKEDLPSRFNPVGKPDCNVLQEAFDAKG
jgi:hypothetical protein